MRRVAADAGEHHWLELETSNGRTIKVLSREHPRARRMSLTVGLEGPKISSPRGTHPAQVKAFLKENVDWLDRKLRELEKSGRKLAAPVPGTKDTVLWRGWRLPVRWEHSVFPRVRIELDGLVVGLDLAYDEAPLIAQRAMRSFVVAQMKREVARLVKLYEPMVGKEIAGTRLLPLKSLWGSLSGHGRMTLDLALMLAPPAALEYVVAHEMSHLWIRNHGRRFWQRVEAVYPDYLDTRAWLNKHGYAVKAELARWIGTELA
ncbi:MAG TPA: YgjP-like metallopeptidase domain-containing protein [Xanthomonadales bacterium]|nr:YgjP-like metallopeptidase domain-containing protein [Xanthomonadales bacterium]